AFEYWGMEGGVNYLVKGEPAHRAGGGGHYRSGSGQTSTPATSGSRRDDSVRPSASDCGSREERRRSRWARRSAAARGTTVRPARSERGNPYPNVERALEFSHS